MTPADLEKIALWMGWRKERPYQGEPAYAWVDKECYRHGWVQDKTSLTDAESVEALNRIKAAGWDPVLDGRNNDNGWILTIIHPLAEVWSQGNRFDAPTIHEAIEQALLALISKED